MYAPGRMICFCLFSFAPRREHPGALFCGIFVFRRHPGRGVHAHPRHLSWQSVVARHSSVLLLLMLLAFFFVCHLTLAKLKTLRFQVNHSHYPIAADSTSLCNTEIDVLFHKTTRRTNSMVRTCRSRPCSRIALTPVIGLAVTKKH